MKKMVCNLGVEDLGRGQCPQMRGFALPCYTLHGCQEQGQQRIPYLNQAVRRNLQGEGKVPSVVPDSAQVHRKGMKNGRGRPLLNTYNAPSTKKANSSLCILPAILHHLFILLFLQAKNRSSEGCLMCPRSCGWMSQDQAWVPST